MREKLLASHEKKQCNQTANAYWTTESQLFNQLRFLNSLGELNKGTLPAIKPTAPFVKLTSSQIFRDSQSNPLPSTRALNRNGNKF